MLLLYLPRTTARSSYTLDHLLTRELGIAFTVTSDRHYFESYGAAKINYSGEPGSGGFFIRASPLLFETGTAHQDVRPSTIRGLPVLFTSQGPCDLGFDIFAASFYLLSRYEEYLPYTPDRYGRFDVQGSVAWKHHFLHLPVVQKWGRLFRDLLLQKGFTLPGPTGAFRALLTYDVDVAYKYKGRSLLRNTGSILRDVLRMDWANIRERQAVARGVRADPWDTYRYLLQPPGAPSPGLIFFFLLGDRTRYDRNIDYRQPVMRQLVREIASQCPVGIHPSFYTAGSPQRLLREKQRLEEIAGLPVTRSRQHFLKFRLPQTYRSLIEAGVTEDYSMGYPYQPGFRAGTCRPFAFYDLESETATGLTLYPVTLMEGNFMAGNPEAGSVMNTLEALIGEVKEAGGIFLSIWHNHTVSDTPAFRTWRNIHDRMRLLAAGPGKAASGGPA